MSKKKDKLPKQDEVKIVEDLLYEIAACNKKEGMLRDKLRAMGYTLGWSSLEGKSKVYAARSFNIEVVIK